MSHLTRDELIALAEARGIPDGHHAGSCVRCHDEVLALRAVIEDARAVDIPEPSPLFWDHFSARVRHAIDEDDAASRVGVQGVASAWPWRLVLGSLSAAVVAGLIVVSRGGPASNEFTPISEVAEMIDTAEPVTESSPMDSGIDFELVADVAGELTVGDAGQALDVGAPGASDSVLSELSDEEQQELATLLRAELEKGRPS